MSKNIFMSKKQALITSNLQRPRTRFCPKKIGCFFWMIEKSLLTLNQKNS